MARDPEAGRLAARLLLLHAYDREAARHLARVAELHIELGRQLRTIEAWTVAAAGQAERVSGSGPDETEAMLSRVSRLRAAAATTRALLKARRQALRRLVGAYEDALGLRHGLLTELRSGRQVVAMTWTDPNARGGRRTDRAAPKED